MLVVGVAVAVPVANQTGRRQPSGLRLMTCGCVTAVPVQVQQTVNLQRITRKFSGCMEIWDLWIALTALSGLLIHVLRILSASSEIQTSARMRHVFLESLAGLASLPGGSLLFLA